MRLLMTIPALIVLAAAAALDGTARSAQPQPTRLTADGSLEMAGYKMRCGDVETRLDRRLPNLGAASPGEALLWINPKLLAQETPTVRLFVFHHECGHHHVGASELGSDCWAVEQGVAAGWLGREGLQEVCDSFGDAPESATHPSAKRRCANLDRCFAAASSRKRQTPVELAAVPAVRPATAASSAAPARAPDSERATGAGTFAATVAAPASASAVGPVAAVAPRLVGSPRLLWTGEAP